MREIVNFLTFKTITNIHEMNFVYVLNNSSCDMDSTLSSIVLAFMRNIENQVECKSMNEITYNQFSKTNKIFIPLMNCKKGELFQRLDISLLFRKIGLNEDDVMYIDEIFNENNKINHNNHNEKNRTNLNSILLILVDFFDLPNSLSFLSSKVIEI